jgi:hypothetical protein
MNRNFVHPALAVAVAAFLATGAAVAQSTAPAATPPMTAPSGSQAGTPSTAPSMMAPATDASKSPAAEGMLPSKTDSASAAFGKLSTKHQGYVTSDDVSKLQGFNFKTADKNNDGKLDQTEFNAAWSTYSGTTK